MGEGAEVMRRETAENLNFSDGYSKAERLAHIGQLLGFQC